MATESYSGSELPLFLEAENFHGYYMKLIGPWLRGSVLEVGAGIGAMTKLLSQHPHVRLVVCEPDSEQAEKVRTILGDDGTVVVGDIRDVPTAMGTFDAIVYVDVLEHIERDRAEVEAASDRLAPRGVLVIAGPAHPGLYSPFDASIGHHRRYNREMLEQLVAPVDGLELRRFQYFDCVGALLSLLNRWCARQSEPGPRILRFWNKVLIPLSRCLDPLFGYRLGKSFVAIVQRTM